MFTYLYVNSPGHFRNPGYGYQSGQDSASTDAVVRHIKRRYIRHIKTRLIRGNC